MTAISVTKITPQLETRKRSLAKAQQKSAKVYKKIGKDRQTLAKNQLKMAKIG